MYVSSEQGRADYILETYMLFFIVNIHFLVQSNFDKREKAFQLEIFVRSDSLAGIFQLCKAKT
jgi:hypothetical protein